MPNLFINARIRTLGPSGVTNAILADDAGFIIALGSDAMAHPAAPTADVTDLGSKTVLPGPVDAHVHLLSHAEGDLNHADLGGATSLDELLDRLAGHRERRPAGWLVGYGFDQELFPDHAYPTRADLDRVSPDRPLMISRLCGHAIVVNSRALELGGTASESGVLTEERMAPIYTAIPERTAEEWVDIARHAVKLAVAAGFTGCHVLIQTAGEAAAFQALHNAGELPIRIRLQYPYRLLPELRAAGLSTGFGDDWLSIGCIKIFSDGAMGARTAALTTGYEDEPNNVGELIYPPETLKKMCAEVHEAGFQLAIHAIGDRAMDVTMDAIVSAAGSETRPVRHRIEHSSITRPDQIDRLAETGIVSCVQPQFTVTDFWTVRRLGESRKGWIYPFASMLKKGAILAGGTDCPVERLDAMEAIGRAVTRDAPWRGEDIAQGYVEEECFTIDQAWDVFTKGSAYSGFAEKRFGTLEPGMQCDFIVLDQDPFTADPRTLETMKPAMTVTAGVARYRRDD